MKALSNKPLLRDGPLENVWGGGGGAGEGQKKNTPRENLV